MGQVVCVLLDPTRLSSAVTRFGSSASMLFFREDRLDAYLLRTSDKIELTVVVVVRIDSRWGGPYYFRNVASMEK